MQHYHGTPITPRPVLYELACRSFCASYSDPRDVAVCHDIGQSVMLDNGAFSAWTRGAKSDWEGFVAWARPWLDYQTTWAVMPDIIQGSEWDNQILSSWLFNYDREVWRRCAPVWHMNETINLLKYLCMSHDRVCISSGGYAAPGSDRWRARMDEAMNAICPSGRAPTQLHMLQAMAQVAGGDWPFASADSTNFARNHHRRPPELAADLAAQLDARQAPGRWRPRPEQIAFGFPA
jgi:hypothetical protein